MKYTTTAIILFLLQVCQLQGQSQTDTTAIKKQLYYLYERDQRRGWDNDSLPFIDYIDSCNLALLEQIIAQYGWPGKSFVGTKGNTAAFLVIQHANLKTQEKYLPMMQRSADSGESSYAELAMLQDRVLMRQGKKQIYGSQVVFNKTSGAQEFYPIEDEKNVNVRRKKAGLQPLEEYAKYFGIKYEPPAE